jgi:prepilin signal peptidase PulO-like enzyme (type II secretory pathway)
MILDYLLNVFVFVFGLCVGSFLNCVIYRLESKKSLKGRSFCPHCKHALAWQDLFPVFSFLFLKGKCRYCNKKIFIQYPLVEIATGLLFLLIYNLKFEILNQFEIFKYSNILNLLFLFYITSVLIIIFVYDLKHYIIPDKILFPAIIIAFLYRVFENLIIVAFIENLKFKIENFAPLGNYIFAVIIASGFFLAVFLATAGRGMGFGDVKLALLLGILLGFPNILVCLFLAFFFGAIIGLILMAWPASAGGQKKGLKSEIPFGPFLIAGTFLAIFFGSQITQWYLKIFQI